MNLIFVTITGRSEEANQHVLAGLDFCLSGVDT